MFNRFKMFKTLDFIQEKDFKLIEHMYPDVQKII